MTEKTSAELEHDAEIARAKVSGTADSLRNKMSPGQLIDEFAGMFTGDGGVLTTLKSQVQANPLPVALVGVGLAWLMAGQRGGQSETGASAASRREPSAPLDFDQGGDVTEDDGSAGFSGGFGVTGKAGSMVGFAADALSTAASEAAEGLSDKASAFASVTAEQTTKATAAATDLLRQEPLVLAAVGLALGTAIGAILPRTDFEDQQVGELSDKVRDQASQILDRSADSAKDVARQAFQTIRDEADRHGLAGDGSGLVDQVKQVLQTTATQTEKRVRGKLKEAADKLPGSET